MKAFKNDIIFHATKIKPTMGFRDWGERANEGRVLYDLICDLISQDWRCIRGENITRDSSDVLNGALRLKGNRFELKYYNTLTNKVIGKSIVKVHYR